MFLNMFRNFFSLLAYLSIASSHTLHAKEFVLNDGDVVGQVKVAAAQRKDTLYDIGMAHGVGFTEMRKANPEVDAWLPKQGAEVVIPSEFILPSVREGVVINLREYRLYFFPEDSDKVITYPLGIGSDTTPSPVTSTRVKLKIEKPNWYPSASARAEHFKEYGEELARVVYPGPDNPLGPFAIQLDLPDYFIHGTNKRFGIGTKISRGCIRLDNDDLSKFVWQVPKYTPVRFIEEPVKLGMRGDDLMLELHFEEDDRLVPEQVIDIVNERVQQLKNEYGIVQVDSMALQDALATPTGLPQKIGTKKADLMEVSLVETIYSSQ